ncbi:L-threonylcarbamoyladenylate synthase [Paucilactobacillus wasatchensis]|uniref:Threonylcarbamoyl-AMP synthase n=1 Tax=Paucilactobacillus wasatchensis TaxID=1335616 RepID=A0A0D0Y7L5_9LACO|nr:L-threonylcarbamoyladenylate synthase [Paucilactobacillus wasatchensis]KIS04258.1 YrdC/Sua5 family protein, required for threonylcarbamoyladenosine (t(6)A) formation in tRNA [Paucilactobacillus wasatchensis]
METKIFKLEQIQAAADLIKAGELVAFPTETVYGLGADATNEQAVKKVYAAKGRPSDNPLIVHIASLDTVEKYAAFISPDARKLMQQFWPGSLTMIFKLKPGAFSMTVTGGLATAAFRFPDNQATLKLIKTANCPLVGPSANTSGKPSPTTAQHVYHDLNGKIAGILDDGPTRVGVESTVLDMSTDEPVILRPGAVTKTQIESIIGSIETNHHHVGKDETPKAPGMKYKHYAPKAQVYIVDRETDWNAAYQWATTRTTRVGVMAEAHVLQDLKSADNVTKYSLGEGIAAASAKLFAGLRQFDDQPTIKAILVQAFPTNGLGNAYMNRLNKSAGEKHFKLS